MSRVLSARALAARALAAVLERDVTLEAALEQALREAPATLHANVRSLGYGAVRGYFRHEALLKRLLAQPLASSARLARALLSVALFELEDARTPQYAVVDAAVEAARDLHLHKLTGLINALLRRYLREREPLDADLARNPAVRHAFPEWLAQQIRADWPVRWTQILAASDRQAPLWLRINARRAADQAYLEELRKQGMPAHLQPQVPHALVLEKACEVGELPGFGDGRCSVQDLGAQCVAFPLALAPGQRVLDACAAPGGKTALIAERQPRLAALWAVDVDAQRVPLIEAGLARLGCEARVCCADAARPDTWWDGQGFDRILLDAPCSALGVIRRHSDIRLRRRPGDIDKFASRQQGLLRALFDLLLPGGRLVYATCTVTRRENRDTIAAFLAATPTAAMVPPVQWEGWPDLGETDECGVQILPGEAGADGFYYAALTKQ
ncbi:MAG: 16S rRNA (cytosine(967)-C(5))-methyltransferase RsmB [Proteobacteria bacterium]|nr:16S rRNA (cytosine(967)-C(5))-methyltransferase RsmB [Pseudomonadota bacterium]